MGASIFEVIRGDHRRIDHLFRDIELSQGVSKMELIAELTADLVVHLRAESAVLYSRIRSLDEIREDILESEVEHGLIEQLALDLQSTSPEDEELDAKLAVLRELVRLHVTEEENEILPAAARLLERAQTEALGDALLAHKHLLSNDDSGAPSEPADALPHPAH
jgi:hemerythrin superfamily protein